MSSETVQNGGTLVVDAGAVDYVVNHFGRRLRDGSRSATGDQIYGTQLVNGATATVTDETVQGGGTLILGGASTATNTALNGGGTVELASPTATLSGSLTFADGGNTLDIAAIPSSGDGDQAVISGFSSTDKIVISGVGAGAALSFSTSGGNEIVTVSGGSGAETLHLFRHIHVHQQHAVACVIWRRRRSRNVRSPPPILIFQPYNPSEASTISAGPLAIYGGSGRLDCADADE